MNQPHESEDPGKKRYVLVCPTCNAVIEVPRERLDFAPDGRLMDGPGSATCPNGHAFDFCVGSLREVQ